MKPLLTDIVPPYQIRTRRHHIAAIISDMITNLLYYNRKEDSIVGPYDIEDAIIAGEVHIDEIADSVRHSLERAVENRRGVP